MSNPEPVGYYYPPPQDPRYRDAEHLRLLAIFHFVAGGLLVLFGFIPVIYIVLGVAMLNGKLPSNPGSPPPPAQVGYIFIAMGSIFMALGWALATCLIISGRFLQKRRNYMFSFVIAAISCLQIPFGTLLGIFTIIVLSRDSVKAIYGRQ
jgi:hypothetical protein